MGPKILEARAAIGAAKITYLDRVAEQGRGGLLFLITGRVGNSASYDQNDVHIHKLPLSCEPSTSFGREGEKGKHRRIHELHGSSQGRQHVCLSWQPF